MKITTKENQLVNYGLARKHFARSQYDCLLFFYENDREYGKRIIVEAGT